VPLYRQYSYNFLSIKNNKQALIIENNEDPFNINSFWNPLFGVELLILLITRKFDTIK